MDFISKPENSTRKNEPGFEALFQNATIGILAITDAGIIELANPFVEKMLGFDVGELRGHQIEELVPEGLRKIHKEHRKDYLKEPKARPMGLNLDLHARRKDGSLLPVEISLAYYQSDGRGMVVVYIADITLRKKAEETLHHTEERYRLFFEAIQETLVITEAVKDSTGKIIDLRFIDLNRQAEIELGKPRTQLIGRLRSEVLGKFDDELRDIVNRVIVKKELVKKERYVPLFKKWYEAISYSPFPDQMVSLGIDLTYQKKQDNNLRRANIKLRQRTETLQKLNSELRDLAYISSHHLQEPLRKLQTFVTLLQRSHTNGPDIKGKEFLSKVVLEASIARERVEDVLFFINLNINKRKKVPVSLMVLLKNVLEEMRPEIENMHGTVELVNEPAAIYGDPDLIKHLFHHLISNGLKFHKPGLSPHIKIYSAITSGNAHVHLPTVQINFEDNGIGIDEKYTSQIFGMFKKLNKEILGSGVGLAVSRKICNLHGGSLTVKSKVGEGAIFTVSFPMRL